MSTQPPLQIWTIYNGPEDYPGRFVARKFLFDQMTPEVLIADSLDAVRSMLPRDFFCIPRDVSDPQSVVESWI